MGKIMRIFPDGRVPPDNPFIGRTGARPEIWSYGHRNVQGATLDPATGRLWTIEHGTPEHAKGRVFVSILGHYTWTFDDPLFRVLILRGICWSAKQPIDHLSELATIGARMEW